MRAGTSVLTAALAAMIAMVVTAGCAPLTSSAGPPSRPATSPAPPPMYSLPTAPASAAGGSATTLHWGTVFGTNTGMLDMLTAPMIMTLPGTVAEVGSSNSTEYALLTSGALYAWGVGTTGELGDGGTQNSLVAPVRVQFPAGVTIAWIPTDAMPYDTGLAVDTTGHVWGWGENGGGELCLGSTAEYSTPVRLPFSSVTAVAGASNHALYDSHARVFACGQNLDGDLGDGSTASTTKPVPVSGLPNSPVTTLVASFANSGALLADGQYDDWGYNAAGQLGDGTAGRPSDVPVAVSLPHPVRQVALGGSLWNNGQTLVLLSTGAVWAWGNDEFCQLGTGRFGVQPDPVHVFPPAGVTYRSLATGSGTAYAISTAGDLYAWGVSHVGQVGNGGTETVCTPAQIASHAVQISSTADNVVMSLDAHS